MNLKPINYLIAGLILLFVNCLNVNGQSSTTGSINGMLKNADGAPLSGAHVAIQNTNKGTQTDSKGYFEILNIKPGSYIIEVSYVGHQTQLINATVKANKSTSIPTTVMQSSDSKLNEVLVQGTRNPYMIEELSSTLRINTPLIKTPQNIQVISGELLQSQQTINMMENVTRNVSGAQMIEHWGHFARINMRGFNLPAFRNGMNVSMPWGPLSQDMSMVERIEFVKGPAGFMLAAGEPGGFYNVVTKKPTAKRVREVSITGGNLSLLRATLDLGGALTQDEKLQFRFNTMVKTEGSHRDFEESKRVSVVPALKYNFSDRTSLSAEYTYQYADTPIGRAYVFAPVDEGYASLPRSFSMLGEVFPNTDIKETSLFANFSHNLSDTWSFQAQYSTTTLDQEGMSTWTYGVAPNGDATRSANSWDALNVNNLAQLFVSGVFNTGTINHNVLVGADYSDKKYWADWAQSGLLNAPTDPFNIHNPVYNGTLPTIDRSEDIKVRGEGGHQGIKTKALYVQDEIGFFENSLRLTLAGRYTNAEDFAYGNTAENSKFTPRVGLSYDIRSDFTAYALYDQSFSPQFGASASGEKFKPEEANDMEVGLKKTWFDGRLKTNVTAYQITKQNILVSDPDNANFSIQLGEIQSKGIEFDMQGQITPELNVVFNYANTNVEITKDTNEANIGTRVAGHAKHINNAWLNYNFKNDSGLKGFGLSLGYQYQADRSSWSWGVDNQTDLPDYFRVDGGVSWKNDKFNVRLYINNIFNKYLYSGANYGTYLYWQSEPGTNGRLSVAFKF